MARTPAVLLAAVESTEFGDAHADPGVRRYADGWVDARLPAAAGCEERGDVSQQEDRAGPVPGVLAATPRELTACTASRIPSRPRRGRPAHPALRAGSPLRTPRGHHGRRAAPGSPSGAGRTLGGPVSECDRVPGPGTPPGPGVRSSRPRWPNGESSSRRAVSRPHVYAPRAFRDGWPEQMRRRGRPWRGTASRTKKVKMTQGIVKWFSGDRGYGFIAIEGPGRVRTPQRYHRRRLPQPGGRAEGRIRHHPGPEGVPGGKRQSHRLTPLAGTTSAPPKITLADSERLHTAKGR